MKKWLFSLVLVVLVTAGVGYYFFYSQNHQQWVVVQEKPLVDAVYGLGTVKADQEYQLAAGLLTSVQKLYVKEGDSVQKGSPLVQLTHQPLFSAPFSGVVTALPIHENEIVHPSDELLTLTNLNKRYLIVSMEQRDMVQIKLGQKVDISFESLRSKRFQGKIDKIYPSKGDLNLRINLPADLPVSILPGMTADVAVEVGYKPKAIVLPVDAVVNDQVTIKRNGQQKKIAVKTKALDEENVEILSGDLKPGDQVRLPKGK